jgi:hypothetical protein
MLESGIKAKNAKLLGGSSALISDDLFGDGMETTENMTW